MTDAADLVLTNAEVHTLADPDQTHEALAVRDGHIVRVDRDYEVAFLDGVETTTVDLDGRVVLPGFVDAHTHMATLGRSLVHTDLSEADNVDDCVDRLREADGDEGWILGFGYDESAWDESRYLTREDLDLVSEERPVCAFREDLHVASINGVALDRYVAEMSSTDVRTEAGEPTGVIVEAAVDVVREAIRPGSGAMRGLLVAAQDRANALGVTGVHDMVRRSHAPRVYRDLDRSDDLSLRVRLNYWSDHLDAADELGLRTNHGSAFVRTGAIKTYTDGSLGGRTAKLFEPYVDGAAAAADPERDGSHADEATADASPTAANAAKERPERDGDHANDEGAGRWVVAPEDLRDLVGRADDDEGFQIAAHAIGDEAIETTLDTFEETVDPGSARHRVEHAELLTDEQIERFGDTGVVASVQPNFLKWAREDGLYDARLGPDRRARSNRYADLLDAGVHLAFGSDCMPLDPLYGIHETVTAPLESQRLSVTEALRAYTHGPAYAGFDDHRLGTIEVGKLADLVVLDRSPWDDPDGIDEIDVVMTIVDGEIVYENA